MKNICAIYRTDRIGDFICSIPAIYAVRKMLPQHHITLVTNSQNAPIASFLPCIDEHRVYNPLQPFPFTTVDYAILLNEQGEEFYEAIKESTIYHRYGVWKTMSFFERWRSYSLRERTETEKMLHYVKSINPQLYEGISSLPECPILYSAEKKTIAEEILLPFLKDEKKIILISPIKEGASKVVADSLYPTILQMIHARFPQVGIVVIVSEFDKERGEAIMRALPEELERCILFINKSDLSLLVALIDHCDIFIGSSSGPTHIAGLLNKKVIAFYPHNKGHSPKRWGVQGEHVKYILAEKRIDELSVDHPRRFGERHLEALCFHIKDFLQC